MDESVIERSEDTGDAKDKLAYSIQSVAGFSNGCWPCRRPTFANLGTELNILLRTALNLLLRSHGYCSLSCGCRRFDLPKSLDVQDIRNANSRISCARTLIGEISLPRPRSPSLGQPQNLVSLGLRLSLLFTIRNKTRSGSGLSLHMRMPCETPLRWVTQ